MPIEGVTGLPVTVERDVEAGMRDGTVLRSDIYRSDSAAEHQVSTAVERFHPRLRVVDPGGTSVNLQEGILRARYRNSVSEPELMSPGKVYEFTIDLGPIGAPVHGGSSLRLDISSSDFPQWDRNLNTGGQPLTDGPVASTPTTQRVFHDGVRASCIHLLIERA